MKVNGDFASIDAEATNETRILENDSLPTDEVAQISLDNFLSALFPREDEEIWLRTFKAKGAPGGADSFPRIYSVTRAKLKENAELLHELHELNQTHGIYFVVNTGGNKDEDIFLFNCFFAEIDDKPISEQHSILDNAPIPPNLRVETRKSVHAYWLPMGGISKEDWRSVQKGLIAYLGSDPKIKNPSRVMRLPGFNHVQFNDGDESYSYKPVVTSTFNLWPRHTAKEMLEAFPPSPEEHVQKKNNRSEPLQRESSTRVSQELLDQYGDGPELDLTTWAGLNRETVRRILFHETATVSGDGEWAHAKGICHNGIGNSGVFLNLKTGAYGCQNDCGPARVRQAFGLPESPSGEPTEKTEPIALSWGDFSKRQFPEVEEIITGLRRSEVGMLVAATNIGKTTLAVNIALSLAGGKAFPPFIKHNSPSGKRVLFVDGESSSALLQRDLRKMMNDWSNEELRLVDENLLLICEAEIDDEPLTLSKPKHMAQVIDAAHDFEPDFIVVDTLSALFSLESENDNAEMKRRVMQPLRKLAKETNSAVFMLHHVGKQSEDAQAGNRAYRGRGASASGALSRLVLVLTPDSRDKNRVTLTCPKSKGPCFEDLVLELNREERWFKVTGEAPPQEMSTYERVVSTVIGFRREVKRKDIEDALGGLSKSTVGRELREAVLRGDLESSRHGWYRAPGNAHMLSSIDNDELNIQNAFSIAA